MLSKEKRISLLIYALKTSFGKTVLAIDIIDNSNCREQASHLLVRCPIHPEVARRLLTLYNFPAFFRHDGGSVSRNANVDSKPRLDSHPNERRFREKVARKFFAPLRSLAFAARLSRAARPRKSCARNWMPDSVRNKRTHDRDFSSGVTYISKLCELNPRKSPPPHGRSDRVIRSSASHARYMCRHIAQRFETLRGYVSRAYIFA